MLFDGIEYQPLVDHLCQMAGDDRLTLMNTCGALNDAISHTFAYHPDESGMEHIAAKMAHVYVMMSMAALHLGVTPEMVQKEVDKWRTS